MSRSLLTFSAAFTGGVVGAIVNSAAMFGAVRYGVLHAMHVALIPGFSLHWLYPRLVWGGLWGLSLTLPLGPRSIVARGLFWSLAPTLFQLLWVFPHQTPLGLFGLGAGVLTPLAILILNFIWGLAAAIWLSVSRG